MSSYDIVVIGGGPAGSAAAITAARAGRRVLLLERGRLPRQRVCGEFVSAEGVETLRELDGDVADALLKGAPRISKSRLFVDGRCVEVPICPEAASITRYDLDLALWQAAERARADCRLECEVTEISEGPPYRVSAAEGSATQVVHAQTVIDASGRWSRIRGRRRQEAGARYLGVKAHFRAAEAGTAGVGRPTVDLYFFAGGYCGVQPIGNDRVNACAMVRADIAASMAEVLPLHPELRERSRQWQQVGEEVATSPLVFERPHPVRGGVMCAGDAAGFVDPFVGDGITLALRSGQLAAEAAIRGDIEWYAREYQRRLAPVFESASWLRRVTQLPAALRKPIMAALSAPLIGRAVLRATRAR